AQGEEQHQAPREPVPAVSGASQVLEDWKDEEDPQRQEVAGADLLASAPRIVARHDPDLEEKGQNQSGVVDSDGAAPVPGPEGVDGGHDDAEQADRVKEEEPGAWSEQEPDQEARREAEALKGVVTEPKRGPEGAPGRPRVQQQGEGHGYGGQEAAGGGRPEERASAWTP